MERRAAAILLMLSLLVGAAVADDIIRLPGDAVMDGARPWDCCDNPRCTKAGLCACKDVVDKCAAACRSCKAVDGTNPAAGYMCRDASPGGPPPRCTEE